MKIHFLLSLTLLGLVSRGAGQTTCSCCNTMTETPAVSKPTDPGILSLTCNTLTIKWKGSDNQSFKVNALYKNAFVNETDLVVVQGIILKPNIASFQYGTHTVTNQFVTYALKSALVDLDQYINQNIAIAGKRIAGYPVEGGPEFIEVLQLGPLSQTIQISDISCDNDQNCMATIPVTAGKLVSWNVQAIAEIDGRTFISYPLLGEQDFPIPSCDQTVATEKAIAPGITSATKEQLVVSNEKLALYPNPVTEVLNVKLSSAYKGSIKLSILDVSGKTVKVMELEKQQVDYFNRISVNTLKPGMYFMNIHLQDGKSFTTKFIKN